MLVTTLDLEVDLDCHGGRRYQGQRDRGQVALKELRGWRFFASSCRFVEEIHINEWIFLDLIYYKISYRYTH